MTHKSKNSRIITILALLALPLVLLTVILAGTSPAVSSSHREAPLIAQDPFADNTDTYVWIPAGQTENIVLAASWIPFELPEGGPNYYTFDEDVNYTIHVDTDGDAVSDYDYILSSSNREIDNLDTFLYNVGPVTSLDDPDLNVRQYYTVTEVVNGGPTSDLVANVLAPPPNIGSKSTPDYDALATEAIYDAGDGVTVFAGPTDDAFWVDLQVFDLLTLRGQEPPIGYEVGSNCPIDSASGFNVHSLVIEMPIDRLVDGEPVLGVWATASRLLMPLDGGGGEIAHTQVSRLGMPLVNEVVLPLGLKDTFNAISPDVDLTVYDLLQESVEDPEVGNLLCALYGVPLPGDANSDCATEYTSGTPRTGRGDIFDIFLTGMVLASEFTIQTADGPLTLPAGFNVNQPAGVVPAEMIRINTGISGDLCSPDQQRLGVLAGDACGFPNGRRPADDVIDIELLAVAGAAYEVLDDRDDTFTFDPGLITVLDDGLNENDVPFQSEFPYFAFAQSGQDHQHQNRVGTCVPTNSILSALDGNTNASRITMIEAGALGSLLIAGAAYWLIRRRPTTLN